MTIDSISPLLGKIQTPPSCKLQRAFAVWTDLLGFGKPFANANWSPDPSVWHAQARRIGTAYRTQCQNIHSSTDDSSHMLLLNDGMVRSLAWRASAPAIELGFWLRAALFAHWQVLSHERQEGLPGPRTIVASGWVAEHSFSEVRFDDLVLNYTRAEEGMSTIAKRLGNPVLVSNPTQLQLNTAFSRAFILDEAGSKAGISGAWVYVDQSFLDAVATEFAPQADVRVNNWLRESDRIFAVELLSTERQPTTPEEVLSRDGWLARQPGLDAARARGEELFPSRRQPWAFGLLLDPNRIEVALPNLQTSVHRVLGFFPYDEDPSDFLYDLDPSASDAAST